MIGILNAYHFDLDEDTYQKDYAPMLSKYLESIDLTHELKEYKVAQGIFPKDINECDGWIITGSPASCYDDEEWIKALINFTKECHEHKKKLLGICFGHQLIAHALGGKVEKSNKGWGVGIREFEIYKNAKWMNTDKQTCSLIFSHQDQVIKLPNEALLLSGDDFCPNQIFSMGDHIFSVQGHPEFTTEYAKKRYDTRIERLGEKVYKSAIKSLVEKKDDNKIFGEWIKNFFK